MAGVDECKRWDGVWVDVHLATMAAAADAPYGAIENGAMALAGGRIEWLGARAALPDFDMFPGATVHSGNGCWITPGLIDCHTHLVYAGNRAREFERRLQGESYESIARAGGGILSTVAATRAASESELIEASTPRLAALAAEGVTTVEIKSGYGLDEQNELKMLAAAKRLGEIHGMNTLTTFLGAHALPPEFQGEPDRYIDNVCKRMLPAVAEAGLADAVDAFCEGIGFNLTQTERVFAAAAALELPVKLHAEQLSHLGGASLAARYGALSADHLEYADSVDVGAMAESDTVAVLLPGAFYFLKEQRLPPVELFRAQGVPIAIATDCNPGSSPVCSLLSTLNMGCTLFGLTPEEALTGVTRHAAAALGIVASHGTLEQGKQADFVLWDVAHPSELAYHLGLNPCRQIVKGGVAQ